MTRKRSWKLGVLLCAAAGCSRAHADDSSGGAPPPAQVVSDVDVGLFSVDNAEAFPLAPATARAAERELVVTGTVGPDVSRNVPVVSMASGRVVAIHGRVGDEVKAGQRMLTVRSDDVVGGTSDYRKAVADELLARSQLERATLLYEHGATSRADLEVAENAENKAKVDVSAKAQHLKLLGTDPERANGLVEITAPVSGVITDQQVTIGAAVQALGSNAFTISDLSHVWIICDVYENDLASVRVGDRADIRLNAYPDQRFQGTISNIGSILDPTIRTAKMRIEVANPGLMRLNMFVTATFRGQTKETRSVVPAAAVLHLHDRDWVYVPAPDKKLRRVEVVGGSLLPDGFQEIKSGIEPGQQVVADALVLEHAIDQ